MKLSVSSYSFHQYVKKGEMTLFDVIDKAAELGFEGIEFIDLPKDLPHAERLALAKKLRAYAEEKGLAVVAYAVGARLWKPLFAHRREVARVLREVEVAAALGAPVMRHDLVWALTKRGRGKSFFTMIPKLAKDARKITEYAAQRGVKTCSENHGYVAQDSERMEAFVKAVAHPNYGLLVDMGNFLCVDEEPLSAVTRVAPYVIHAHAKDMLLCDADTDGGEKILKTRGNNHLKPVAVGEGSVPVADCITALKSAGYDGWLTLEYEGKEDCLAAIPRGLAFLREHV